MIADITRLFRSYSEFKLNKRNMRRAGIINLNNAVLVIFKLLFKASEKTLPELHSSIDGEKLL